jgi:hypothetical protein
MKVKQIQKFSEDIYSYDRQIKGIFRKIKNDLPQNTIELITKYNIEMINTSKAKGTRRKHLHTLYSLSKLLGKEWESVTKDDIDVLVSKIMQRFAEQNGQESSYSYDHKKILKIFFRWFKLESREQKEVGDPEETRKIRLGK